MRNSTVEQQLIEVQMEEQTGIRLFEDCGKNFSQLNLHLVSLFFSKIAATHVVNGLRRLCYHTIQKKIILTIRGIG